MKKIKMMLFKGKPRARQPHRVSAKPPTAKYYSSDTGSNEQTSPFRRASKQPSRRSRILGRLFDLLVFTAAIGFLLYALTVKGPAEVKVNSEAYHPVAEYEQTATNFVGALTNKTKLTFDEQGVVDGLKKKYPEVADIDIQLPVLSQRPTLRISVYEPVLILHGASDAFVIDSQGQAVGTSIDFPGVEGLIPVSDQSGFSFFVGQPVLGSSAVKFIAGLNRQLKKEGISIGSLVLPREPHELVMKTADRPYSVRFLLTGDPVSQVGQYLAARAQLERDGVTPAEYLDVRVQGKVFYR